MYKGVSSMNAELMYQEIILDHAKNPRNYGMLIHPTASAEDANVSCGDKIRMQIVIKENKIQTIKFHGNGCAISQAAASLLTEHVVGKDVQEVWKMTKEEALALLHVPLLPMRLKCGLLGFKVVKLAICAYLDKETAHD